MRTGERWTGIFRRPVFDDVKIPESRHRSSGGQWRALVDLELKIFYVVILVTSTILEIHNEDLFVPHIRHRECRSVEHPHSRGIWCMVCKNAPSPPMYACALIFHVSVNLSNKPSRSLQSAELSLSEHITIR